MQGERGAIGSFPETLTFEHSSTPSDVVNSPSNRLPDFISLNPTNQEGHISTWDVGQPSTSSGSNQANQGHIEPRPDCGWPLLGDHGSSSSSFSDPFGPSSDPFDIGDHHMSRKRKAVELTMGGQSSSRAESLPSDPTIPRLGLSIGENPLASGQQVDSSLAYNTNNNNRESDVSSDHLSSQQGQPVLRLSALRRNFQSTSRWSRHSTSRATRSPNLVISGDQNELGSMPDHPVFPPPRNITEPNYNPRRLSAILRRSLYSAAGSEGGGGQNGNFFSVVPPALSGSSSSSQDVGSLPGLHHQPYLRSPLLLGRQLEGAYLSRAVTPGSEGRVRLVSEIRNVLDVMRRGESLRLEDVVILDQSVFYGIADIHDRHRDMRLDTDNMSYEELLALEERIGNVNTGLTEETISKHLKQKPYVVETSQPDMEPCCVCQEEYKDGDDLGTLECGHEFHHGCIKQWLQHKNLCPICKSAGFSAT